MSDASQTAGLPVRRWARWVRFLPAAVLMHLLLVGTLWMGVEWVRSQIGHRPEPPRQIMVVELIPAKSRAEMPPSAEPTDASTSERRPDDKLVPAPTESDAGSSGGNAGRDRPLPASDEPSPVQKEATPAVQEEPPAAEDTAPRVEATPTSKRQDADDMSPRAGYTQGATEFITASWEQQVMAHLEQHKRYPAWAQRRGQEDVVQVHVRLDRDGKVLSHSLVGGAGYRLLDEEAMSLFVRADPLPPPPAEVPDRALEFRVPIEFYIDRNIAQLW